MAFGTILGQTCTSENLPVSDSINQFLGIPNGSMLDVALLAIATHGSTNAFVHIQFTVNGKPAKAGMAIDNIKNFAGESMLTDDNGIVIGQVELDGSRQFTTGITGYEDFDDVVETVTVPEDESIYYTTIELGSPKAGDTYKDENARIWFSPYVNSIDVHVIDAGEDGISSNIVIGTAGGDGAYQGWELNLQPGRWNVITDNQLIVGQSSSEESSFLGVVSNKSQTSAQRGAGGRRVNYGEDPSAGRGGNSQIRLYGTGDIVGGGGGGGGYNNTGAIGRAAGGSPAGNGQRPGGGGYGQSVNGSRTTPPQNGGPGRVYYRWRVETV